MGIFSRNEVERNVIWHKTKWFKTQNQTIESNLKSKVGGNFFFQATVVWGVNAKDH